jgi:hypothetical protein
LIFKAFTYFPRNLPQISQIFTDKGNKVLCEIQTHIYVLKDKYSRFILQATASLDYSSSITFQNLSRGFEAHDRNRGNTEQELMCDGGSENKGKVDGLLIERNIQKIIAQKDVVFSNSMIEAVNKRIKYDFLYWRTFPDFESLNEYLPTLVGEYNNKPHSALFGFTPQEVFNGLVPSKEAFKTFIKQKTKRREENASKSCAKC